MNKRHKPLTSTNTEQKANSCIIPAWKSRTAESHDAIMNRLQVVRDPDVVFLGSSIMERWKTTGKSYTEELSSNYKPLNAGVGGDKTQNLLWRIDKGLFNVMKPKLVLLMIGSNNIEKDDPEHVSIANEKIIEIIHEKSSDTKILLFGALPRKDDKGRIMKKIRTLNEMLDKIAQCKSDFVTFVDLSGMFLMSGSLDKIRAELYEDDVHINERGYMLWYESLRPTIDQMLN